MPDIKARTIRTAPDDTIRMVSDMTTETIDEIGAFCERLLGGLSGEMDGIIAECEGTLEQCYDAVRRRIDFRLNNLEQDTVVCRDSLRTQLYTRLDEYFIQGQMIFGLPDYTELLSANVRDSLPSGNGTLLPGGDCLPNDATNERDAWQQAFACGFTRDQCQIWRTPSGHVNMHCQTSNEVDAKRGNWSWQEGIVDDGKEDRCPDGSVKIPGIPCRPTLEGGDCNDETLRVACEQAGGVWDGSRCRFIRPRCPDDEQAIPLCDRLSAVGPIVVSDNSGSKCTVTCVADPSVAAGFRLVINSPCRISTDLCPSSTIVVKDKEGRECAGDCQIDSTDSTKIVVMLPDDAAVYCGPCDGPNALRNTNVVGIETPQAYRFQQRQQPWFRDAVAWEGQHLIDYVNSQTLQEYLDLTDRDQFDYLTGRK